MTNREPSEAGGGGVMAQRYAVRVYTGSRSPQMIRDAGPFQSPEAASAWCDREGYGQVPAEEAWAAVVPFPIPEGDA